MFVATLFKIIYLFGLFSTKVALHYVLRNFLIFTTNWIHDKNGFFSSIVYKIEQPETKEHAELIFTLIF